jgi:hypothetical protein
MKLTCRRCLRSLENSPERSIHAVNYGDPVKPAGLRSLGNDATGAFGSAGSNVMDASVFTPIVDQILNRDEYKAKNHNRQQGLSVGIDLHG